jgi:hypothetical protein
MKPAFRALQSQSGVDDVQVTRNGTEMTGETSSMPYLFRQLLILILTATMVACGSPSIENPIHSTTTSSPKILLEITPPLTNTATSTPHYTPALPQATLSAFSTLEAIATRMPELGISFFPDCSLYYCSPHFYALSPKGQWAVFFSTNDNICGGGLKFVNIESLTVWEIYYSQISEYPCGIVSNTQLEFWSPDGKYVYISPEQGADGGDLFQDKSKRLIRLDLSSGSWHDTNMGSSYVLSPNVRYISYRTTDGVRIHDFLTGVEQTYTVPVDYIDYGRFVWSPDNTQVIYTAVKQSLMEGYNQTGLTVFLIDREDNSMITIFENDTRFIYPTQWDESGKVTFESYLPGELHKYQLNLETNEILPFQ